MDTSRNFLYGVVALQADLISSAHFDEFMQVCADWSTEEKGSLADLFVQRGWIQPQDKAHLESLVERKLQRHSGNAAETLTGITTEMERSLHALRNSASRQTIEKSPEAGSPSGERYSRTQLHATGGIGRVWLARDSQLERDVALKELLPGQSGNAVSRARFLREARITGQLEHPGIIPVYELSHRSDTHEAFYVMRFVKGRTLKEAALTYHQKRREGLPDSLEFLSLLNAFVIVCKTAAYAHSRGIIHRDLKGQNVILGDFGEVVILDWGLAKELGRAEVRVPESSAPHEETSQDVELTLEGEAVGTPAYMAPEQAAGHLHLIDERTDVYGLGAMLYQILTGQSPFSGATTEEVLHKAKTEPPAAPETLWPVVPPTLQAACLRALAKAPAQRFSSAIDLAQEVEHWQEVQRQKAEEELRVSQALYHSLVESIPLCVWRKDREGRFIFANRAFSGTFGLEPGNMIGKTDFDFFPPDLANRIRRDDNHVLATGETLTVTEERPTNAPGPRLVEVIKIPVRDSRGEIVDTQGIFWDMTAWSR